MSRYESLDGRQRGAALFMALLFLVIITLISLGGMRTTTLELRMAGNEQKYTEAAQAAQSAIDGALATLTPANFSTDPDVTVCINTTVDRDGDACTTDLTMADPDGETYGPANIVVGFLNTAPVPRSRSGTSLANFQTGVFQLDSLHDDTANGGGRVNILQGFSMVIPGTNN